MDGDSGIDDERNGAPVWGSTAARAVLVAAALVSLVAAGRVAGDHLGRLASWIEGLGAAGPAAFIAFYAAAVVVLVPASLLTLAAGAIFGLVRGTLYVFTAASIGACAAFLISRYAARGWMEQRVARHPKFAAIDSAVAREGMKIVFLLRLSPVFPFTFLNYALGLTRVRLRDYTVACVGMIPGTLLYVYYGKLAGEVAAVAGGLAPERGAGYYAVWTVGLVATVWATAIVARTARRALEEVSDVGKDR